MFNKSSGPSCTNIVDLVATSISLVDNTGHYNDINDIFLHKDEVITANQIGTKYEYPNETINDENVSGLQSMINYINTHMPKPKSGYAYEDNSITSIKKKVNNSSRFFNFEDNLTLNKVNKSVNHNIKQFVLEDNSTTILKKKINKSKKQLFYEDTVQINKKITTTNNSTYKHYSMVNVMDNHTTNKSTKITNSTYKHYSMVNVNDNHTTNKSTKITNITTKRLPCYIHQDNHFYFNKTVTGSGPVDLSNYYPKDYVDSWTTSLQNLNNIL